MGAQISRQLNARVVKWSCVTVVLRQLRRKANAVRHHQPIRRNYFTMLFSSLANEIYCHLSTSTSLWPSLSVVCCSLSIKFWFQEHVYSFDPSRRIFPWSEYSWYLKWRKQVPAYYRTHATVLAVRYYRGHEPAW